MKHLKRLRITQTMPEVERLGWNVPKPPVAPHALSSIAPYWRRLLRSPKAMLLLGAGIALCCIMMYYRTEVRNDLGLKYLSQVVTGNWSSDQNGISDFWYVVGLLGAVIINFGPLVAIYGFVVTLGDREIYMKLVTAFTSRDLAIEASIVRALSNPETGIVPPDKTAELLQTVRSAVDEAQKDWAGRKLDSKYGPEMASKMRARMKDLEITP